MPPRLAATIVAPVLLLLPVVVVRIVRSSASFVGVLSGMLLTNVDCAERRTSMEYVDSVVIHLLQ